jgi:hypothetical protein
VVPPFIGYSVVRGYVPMMPSRWSYTVASAEAGSGVVSSAWYTPRAVSPLLLIRASMLLRLPAVKLSMSMKWTLRVLDAPASVAATQSALPLSQPSTTISSSPPVSAPKRHAVTPPCQLKLLLGITTGTGGAAGGGGPPPLPDVGHAPTGVIA